MKRIKLRQHRFLSLYQTFTDSGQPIAFEIVRPDNNPVPMVVTFKADRETLARDVFELLSMLMEIYGPRLKPGLIEKIVTGRAFSRPDPHSRRHRKTGSRVTQNHKSSD